MSILDSLKTIFENDSIDKNEEHTNRILASNKEEVLRFPEKIKDALNHYTITVDINRKLRTKEKIPFSYLKKLDTAFSLVQPLSEDIIVFRGIHGSDSFYPEDLGFVSTALNLDTPRDFIKGDCCLLVIVIAKGSKVIRIPEEIGYFGDEDEILLYRNGTFTEIKDPSLQPHKDGKKVFYLYFHALTPPLLKESLRKKLDIIGKYQFLYQQNVNDFLYQLKLQNKTTTEYILREMLVYFINSDIKKNNNQILEIILDYDPSIVYSIPSLNTFLKKYTIHHTKEKIITAIKVFQIFHNKMSIWNFLSKSMDPSILEFAILFHIVKDIQTFIKNTPSIENLKLIKRHFPEVEFETIAKNITDGAFELKEELDFLKSLNLQSVYIPMRPSLEDLKLKIKVFTNAKVKNEVIFLSSNFIESLKHEADIRPILEEMSKNEGMTLQFLEHLKSFLNYIIIILELFDVSSVNLSFLSSYPEVFENIIIQNKMHLIDVFLTNVNYTNVSFLLLLAVKYNKVYLFRNILQNTKILLLDMSFNLTDMQVNLFVSTYVQTFSFSDSFLPQLWGMIIEHNNVYFATLFLKHNIAIEELFLHLYDENDCTNLIEKYFE